MKAMGMPANLMSVGGLAIGIGMMVDGAVVVVENIYRFLFLPLFTLQGVEGKMFSPMAYTISFALVGALVLALTFIPVVSSLLLKKEGEHHEPKLVRWLKRRYRPVLMTASVAILGLVPLLLPTTSARTSSGRWRPSSWAAW